jgi:superfamily II DNA or RNA helicase
VARLAGAVKLRPYQQQLIDGMLAEYRAGFRRIAAVMATGGGKTPTAMTLAEMSLKNGRPTLWIAHRTELIDQAIDKAQQVSPGRRIGRMQGRVKQYRAELVVASIQTASTQGSLAMLKSRRWGLIVVDETHHIAADTYMRLLRELGAFEPDGPLVLGVTATLDRSDGRALGEVFETVASPQIGLIDLIRHPDGPYLVPPRGVRVRIAELDLDRVARYSKKRSAGDDWHPDADFKPGALGAAMSAAMAPKRIVEAWQEHAAGRPTMAFLPTVALSIEQAQTFNEHGIAAVHLDGTTPVAERADALDRFRRGELLVLCNVGLFTEGTDLPSISCVILGRPTSSGSLYQQMVGRGLRLHPGKRDCVVLDVTGVTGRHKLATLASLGGADAPEDMPDELLLYEVDDEELVEPTVEPDEPAGSGDEEPPVYADGDLAHELVDLFGQSHSSWLRTPGGHWFVPAGAFGFVFLRPVGDDRYDLCWSVAHPNQAGEQRGIIQADMEIGYAMAAGDAYVAERPLWQAERNAPWRSERVRGGRTRGEVSDDRMIERAAVMLDRIR